MISINNVMSINGEMRQFVGMDTWIKVRGATGGENEILIREGSLFWITADGVTIDTVISGYIDPQLNQSTSQGWTTREQYRGAVREKKLADCPVDAPIIKTETVQAPEHLAPLLRMGVRFF